MYVLICPCILDPGLRSRGITSTADCEIFERVIERCRRFHIRMIPLPCPETLYLGKDRAPGTYLERLDTHEFSLLLPKLEDGVRNLVSTHGLPLCIIGVNSSPTCGVSSTYYGSLNGGPDKQEGRGVFLKRFPEIPAIDVADFARFRIYLAGPLFSDAEKAYNLRIASLLEEHRFAVYLPQLVGDDTHCRDQEAHREIFGTHLRALEHSDLVVAVIDGADADSGTAWEMGYAYARGIPVIAIRTDFRMAGHHERVNLMLEQSAHVVNKLQEMISALNNKKPGSNIPEIRVP
jgi:nucleoside 2-deoxyribosyltransferase/predicted secreted protein